MLALSMLWSPANVGLVLAQPAPPAWVWTRRLTTPAYQITGDRLVVPDYGVNDAPGAPALPVWSEVVELPAAGDWEIAVDAANGRILDTTVHVAAVPVPDLPAPRSGGWLGAGDGPTSVLTIDRPDPAIYQADAFYPASPAVTGPVQVQRGRRLLPLHVFPFQYNPVRGTLRYHPELTITLRLTGRRAQPTATGVFPFWGAAHAGGLCPGCSDVNRPASETGALRVRTTGRGLYRLTYNNLIAAGVPVTTTDPATFAMSYLGQPIAIQVTGAGDGRFDPGDLVIFYAEPYQGRYEASNVAWFTYGGAAGPRMTTRAAIITGAEPLITTITQTLHVEVNAEYRSDYPRPQDADHWFDTPLSPDVLTGSPTVTRTYDLALDDPLTAGVVHMRAALHGGADRPANPDKSIAIRLNSHAVGTYQWEGLTYYTATASLPAAWLDGAPNRLSLTAAIAQLPGIDFYSVSPDWVELTYPALAEAEGDRMDIEALAPGANDVAVAGFSTPQVQVYDVRNPRAPVPLTTTQAVLNGGSYTLHFWDADLPGPTYALSSEAALLAPLAIEPDAPSTWRTPNHEADYIAIVHPSLAAAIQPLLNHRAAEGLRVAQVDIQDIYDEFSFGRRDPEAIRSFLSYAYHCWNGADCTPGPGGAPNPPQYVLLVGDGHYDFTGVSGTTYPNLIPPYLINIDPWLGETAADNRYVSVDGPDDYLPDMAIGRIPARTPADVTAAVNKIIAYETTAPSGDWQQRVVFVADNNLDQAGDFHAFSDDVRLNWLPAPYDDRMIYYNRDYFSGDAMRTAIKAAFNNDALLVQWFGHGSRFRWGSVSMFNTFDPPALAANDTWPFSVTYACWTGYFINLIVSNIGQSLAETLLLTPQRGSVADLSPSGLHVGDALLVLDQGLTQAIFRQRIGRAGLAVDAAKAYYFGHSGSFHDVIDTSVFFGDPALKLRLPPVDLSTSTAAVSPAQAAPGATLHYTVTLQNTGTFTATDVTVAVDYADAYGQVSASAPAAVDAGGVLTWTVPSVGPGATPLTFDLQLASVLPAGTTTLHAPAAVRSWGNVLADLDPVSQVSAAPQLNTSSLAVSRAWAPPAFPLTYTFTLSNTGSAPSAVTWLTATLPADLVSVASPSLAYDPILRRLTWQGAVAPAAPLTLTFSGVVSPTRTTCGQLSVTASLRDELGQLTPLAAAVNLAAPDVDCDGDVDVADVQQVAAAWAGAYDPRVDLNGDGVLNVLDLSFAAGHWR
jgi:hypothetical protein